MSCEEWETRIAAEDAAATAHLALCGNCREFAAELDLNAQAIRDDSDIRRPLVRRPLRWWAYAAAAVLLIGAFGHFTSTSREQPVVQISFQLSPPPAPEVKFTAPPPPKTYEAPTLRASVIKIVTDDPDVVILLVDSKGDL